MRVNKRMRAVMTAALTVTMAATTLRAQIGGDQGAPLAPSQQQQDGAPPNAGRGPGNRMEMLKRRLNLTPDQVQQLRPIFEDERSRMQAIHANTSLNQQDQRQQMMQLHADENTKINAVLTPDQQKQFAQMEAEQREHMQERRQQGNDAPPPPPPQPPQQ